MLISELPASPAAAPKPLPRPRASPVAEPWKRSWFYCAPGERPVFLWIMGLHAAVAVGAFIAPLPSWPVVLAALGLMVLGGLGTTVCYHRAHAHRGLVLHPAVEHPLIFFAMLNGSGTPATWVANHRLHHATSDTDEDISAPARGFWWAHLRWLWQAGQAPIARYCPDLDRPAYRFWSRMQIPLLALSFFGPLAFGLSAWLWIGPLRLLLALHAQCTINSICHLGPPTAAGGSSRNVWWLTPLLLLQGENWHGHHHAQPNDPRLGQKLHEIDLGWWFVVGMRSQGLAWQVQRPRRREPVRDKPR